MGPKLRAVAAWGSVLASALLLASAVSQWIPRERAGTSADLPEFPDRRIRVEVLNGGGIPGMARAATEGLRALGFDVVGMGNAASFGHDSSVVLARLGNLEDARAVAEALGIAAVVSEPDTGLYVDVTVRLGADWAPHRLPETARPDLRSEP